MPRDSNGSSNTFLLCFSKFFRAEKKRRLHGTAIPRNIEPKTQAQKQLIQELFGTQDPKLISESARELKRQIMAAEPATKLNLSEVEVGMTEDMLLFYMEHEDRIRGNFREFWQGIKEGRYILYSGKVLPAYRILTAAGVRSFEFKAVRINGKITVQIRNHFDEYFEVSVNEDFDLAKNGRGEFYELLTLMVLDFFLKVQLGENYRSVFEQIDFKYFTESEFLNESMLRSRLVSRPLSGTEDAIEDLEDEAKEKGLGEKEPIDDKEMDKKKQIYSYKTRGKLLGTKKVLIDISKWASLLPLANFLDAMEVNSEEGEVKITLYGGAKTIQLIIDPNGNIKIIDYNRGVANLELIRALNEMILDVLNAHFQPEYKDALQSRNPKEQIREIFRAVQESKEAWDGKARIYNGLLEKERLFTIEKVEGQKEHAFESTFYELIIDSNGGLPKLIPMPNMKVDEAIRVIKEGKRRIVQLSIVGIHRMKREESFSEKELNNYITRFILGLNKDFNDLSGEEITRVNAVKTGILAGELTKDPNGFLQEDPEEKGKITIDKVMRIESSGQPVIVRIPCTIVRPYLKALELIVTESGYLRTKTGKKPGRVKAVKVVDVKPPKEIPQAEPDTDKKAERIKKPSQVKPEVKKEGALHDERVLQKAKILENLRSYIKFLKEKGYTVRDISDESGVDFLVIVGIIKGDADFTERDIKRLRLLWMRERFKKKD